MGKEKEEDQEGRSGKGTYGTPLTGQKKKLDFGHLTEVVSMVRSKMRRPFQDKQQMMKTLLPAPTPSHSCAGCSSKFVYE